jgi:protein SCO1/2
MTRRRLVEALLAALLVHGGLIDAAVARAEIPSYDRVRVLATPRPVGAAELVDQDGRPFALDDLRGRVAFVLFGFTNCEDVCPAGMARLRQLQETGALDAERIAYVMISVDGERDTPAAMRAFLAKYSRAFIGLTGEPSRVKPIATAFSAAFFKGAPVGHGDHYVVAHSPQVFVLDPAVRLRAELYNASLEAMTGVATALLEEADAGAR